ncbi:protein tipE [Lepeophtheirus salmonis]|uniref:protein tipE n=1 Tax=Lepeophtheirus salmonis TaxID=72036 RepID=UPI001AEAAD42|nr:protein tipE-like [Lepeophtheirus salmonis]
MALQPLSQKKKEICKAALDLLLFYTTSFFVLLAIFSLFAMIFLVPFFIDPAWATIQADFDPIPRKCVTISGLYIEGKSNCHWSSCEEGCTKTIFNCWQITVNYTSDHNNASNTARLQPNVKGCGYPPRLNCATFIKEYSPNGSTYPCYVSQRISSEIIAVPELDLNEVKSDLFYCLAIPIPCFLLSLAYLCTAYFCIYVNEGEVRSPGASNGSGGIRVNQHFKRKNINHVNGTSNGDESKSMLRHSILNNSTRSLSEINNGSKPEVKKESRKKAANNNINDQSMDSEEITSSSVK